MGKHNTLYITILRYIAAEFYKCMNGLNPTYIQDIVTSINTEWVYKSEVPCTSAHCQQTKYPLRSLKVNCNPLDCLPCIPNICIVKLFFTHYTKKTHKKKHNKCH